MRSPQPNLSDRMNRIDRIREPDSPAGEHYPLSRGQASQKERGKGRDRVVRLSSPCSEIQSTETSSPLMGEGRARVK